MPTNSGYVSYVLEQLSALGQVSARRMFGGVGLYHGGLFFGLLANDTLYFKVGDSNRADYESRGMGRFRPYRDRPELSMTYYEVPADVLEDSEELTGWARRSVEVALACAKSATTPSKRKVKSARPAKGRGRAK